MSINYWQDELENARKRKRTNGYDAASPFVVLYGNAATELRPAGTIIRGLLHAGSITLFYGAPKSGKSFLATDLFLAIASHQPDWMGHEIIRPGPVLYITCEGHAGFPKRLKAKKRAMKWDNDSFPPGFVLAMGRPQLIAFDPQSRTYLPNSADILRLVEQVTTEYRSRPHAVCIDTVFRSFGAGNVNQSDHMNMYLAALTPLLDLGIAVLLVHHATKSSGSNGNSPTPAGSVALIGGADTLVYVNLEGEGSERKRSWHVEMAKDDGDTEPRAFKLKVIDDMGFDPEGYPAISCVIEDTGEKASEPKKRGGRPANQSESDLILRLLQDTIEEHGEAPGPGMPVDVASVVHVDHWRDCFYRRTRPTDSTDTKLKAFNRLLRQLQAQSRIGVLGKHVWPQSTDIWLQDVHEAGQN